MRPGFCGANSSSFQLLHPGRSAASANAAAPSAHRERCAMLSIGIVLEWLVLEIEPRGEVGRCGGGLEFVLPLGRRESVIRLGIDPGELGPQVKVSRGEDNARPRLRAELPGNGIRKHPRCRELAKLPELTIHEVAGGTLRQYAARCTSIELRDRPCLLPQ